MYLDHFDLREAPFANIGNAGCFFPDGSHKATLNAIIYALGHDAGIVKVTGEPGTGKSLLCRVGS
jgi:MSHA biogenesis protein MshM